MTEQIRDNFRTFLVGAMENHLYDECRYFAYEYLADVEDEKRDEILEDTFADLAHFHMEFK